MSGLRFIAREESSASIRSLVSRYHVSTVRQLMAAYDSKESYTYFGITVRRDGPTIIITNQFTETTWIRVDDPALAPDRREEVLNKTWSDTKRFFQHHWQEIESGRMRAVDIGGALYGIAAHAILSYFLPVASLGPLGEIARKPFVWAAEQKGRFYGAAVDEVVALVKGESDLKVVDMVGALGAFTLIGAVPGVVELFGSDGWNITMKVAKAIGGALTTAIDEICEVAGDVVDEITEWPDALFRWI